MNIQRHPGWEWGASMEIMNRWLFPSNSYISEAYVQAIEIVRVLVRRGGRGGEGGRPISKMQVLRHLIHN
jgi:hypothetical protein